MWSRYEPAPSTACFRPDSPCFWLCLLCFAQVNLGNPDEYTINDFAIKIKDLVRAAQHVEVKPPLTPHHGV